MNKFIVLLIATISILIASCPVCYSQSMYDSIIEEGITRYNNGKYDEAIKLFRAAAADVTASAADKDKAQKWISKCNTTKEKIAEEKRKKEIDKLEKFDLSSENLNFPATSLDTVVMINAGSPWSLVSYPSEWCEVQDEINGISIKLAENKSLLPRSGSIVLQSTITYGKKTYSKKHEIPISQSGRDKSIVSLTLHTIPGNATIQVGSNSELYKSGDMLTLHEGQTSISIRKTDFEQFDTTIVVLPYENDRNRNLTIRLVPEFSILELSILPEEGVQFSSYNNPTMNIDGHLIDIDDFLSGSSSRTFESDKPVEMYKLYQGNLIALPGNIKHSVSMSAVDFEPFTEEFEIPAGVTSPLAVNLIAKSGTLTVNAGGVSVGANVVVDSKVRGTAPGTFRITKGTHTIAFQKDGYMTKESVYLVDAMESQDIQMDLDMMPCAYYSISSDPQGAVIVLDGVTRWHTPVEDVRISCGSHSLKILKDGYLPYKENVSFSADGGSLNIHLQEAHPLEVRSDIKNLNIVFIDRETNTVIKTDSLTNSTVDIPYGKYYLELRRFSAYDKRKDEIKAIEKRLSQKDLAYRGRVNFTENMKSLYRLTFQDNSGFLKGNYFLSGMNIATGGSDNMSYRYLANAGLLNLAFIPGYTTSFTRVALFSPEDKNDKNIYLSASCLFLNGEFRVGGSIIEGLDVNANISYSWTPDINGLCEELKWKLPYISGTDLFLGAEVSSRIKTFNVNLKMGEQLFVNGKLNRPSTDARKTGMNYDVHSFEGVQSAFVISAGFTLGSTRGNRMIRLF